MTINNFEEFIDPKILDRGEDYYYNDAVTCIEEISPDKWKAKVEGTEIYNVEIILKDDEITDSSCDCPYDMGNYCKHQVASFFELRDCINGIDTFKKHESKNKEKKLPKSEELDKILKNIDKEKLVEFLKDNALRDDKIYASLMSNFGLNKNTADKSSYYNIIKYHLNAAKDRHSFIDYYHANQATEGADTLLQNAEDAIDNKNHAQAIAMAECVVELMIPALQEVDDSDGYFGMVIDQGFEILYQCSNSNLDDKTRKEFFEYCLIEMKKKKYEGWSDWQLDFLRIAEKLAKDKNELDKLIDVIDNYDKKNSEYLSENLLLLKYNILIKSGNLNEAEKFFKAIFTGQILERSQLKRLCLKMIL